MYKFSNTGNTATATVGLLSGAFGFQLYESKNWNFYIVLRWRAFENKLNEFGKVISRAYI